MVKNPAVNLGFLRDLGSIPGLGIFPGGGYGNSFQYSCLENPMDRGAWWAAVHRELHMTEVTQSTRTRPRDDAGKAMGTGR